MLIRLRSVSFPDYRLQEGRDLTPLHTQDLEQRLARRVGIGVVEWMSKCRFLCWEPRVPTGSAWMLMSVVTPAW